MLNYFILLAGIFIISFGFFILISSHKKLLNITFFLVSLMIGSWILSNFLFQINPTVILLKTIFFISILSTLSLYLWAYFLDGKENISIKFSLFMALLLCSSLFVGGAIFKDGLVVVSLNSPSDVVLGQYFLSYVIYMVLLILGFLSYLIKIYLTVDIERKMKVRFVLIGITLFLIMASTFSLILPTFGFDKLAILDSPSAIVFLIFSSFAVLKYKMFNIQTVATVFLTVVLWGVLLVKVIIDSGKESFNLDIVVLILGFVLGVILIRSVLSEIRRREQLQVLSKQLGEANLHLKDLDKMKTEFVSLASHELLTPVSAIEGYLSMMLDEKLVKLEDPKAVQYMDRVYRSAKRLARLISDMLNISRIEEGRLLVEKKDINMVEVIQQVIEELKFKADEHKQKVVFEDPKASFMTFADPDKVKEILVNIIGNSIKYTLQPGTITVTIEKAPTSVLNSEWGKLEQAILASPVDDQESIHAVGDEHMKQIVGDEQYLIRVKDQGVGIPKEELTKLFKKFHRVGNYSTQESQGTGLGLYITRALVELHHGRIWPDSEGEGKGSTFTFSLPTLESKQAIVDLEAQSPQDKEQLKPLAKPMGDDDTL